MDAMRSLAIGVVVLLLAASLVGANAVTAAERTVLDPGFVTTTLEEEEAYGALRSIAVEQAKNELGANETGLPVSIEPIVEKALPRAYLESQTERNVERAYAYLHGEREELVLAVNLTPVKENVGDAVAAEIRNRSVSELLSLAGMDETGSVEVEGVSVNLTVVAEMGESEQAYREARQSFRADVREAVVDRLVDEAFETRSNDELLALVVEDYDPRSYTESEKERMVDEREAEIRAALRQEIEKRYGDEIDRRIDEQLSEYRDEVRPRIEEAVGQRTGDIDPAVTEAVVELAMVGVDGLTTDMAYDEFETELDAAKDDLADAVAGVVRDRLSEQAPDRIDLTEQMPPGTLQRIEDARGVIRIIDVLSIALPVAAVALIGLLWFVSGSAVITAAGAGVGLLIAGLSGVAAAAVVPSRARTALSGGGADALTAILIGLIDQVFAVVSGQSLAVTAVGAIVLVAAALVYFDVIPREALRRG